MNLLQWTEFVTSEPLPDVLSELFLENLYSLTMCRRATREDDVIKSDDWFSHQCENICCREIKKKSKKNGNKTML